MRCVALDLGLREVALSEVTDGEVTKRAKFKPSKITSELGPGTPPAMVALEAGRQSLHYFRLLTGWGHKVLIVDTTRVGRIGVGQHGKKNDSADADALAMALWRNELPLAHVLSEGRRELRSWLSQRALLVEMRTKLVNSIRGEASARGHVLPKTKPALFTEMFANEESNLPSDIKQLTQAARLILKETNLQIASLDVRITEFCEKEPLTARLMTVPGVGVLVACWFVSVVDEADRFPNGHSVASYLGLCPRERSSGGVTRLGHITRHGNSDARAVLIQAAWTILKTAKEDDPLSTWAHQIAERRGKNIAVVALARRLCGLLWALWKKDTAYDAQRLGVASAKGMQLEESRARYKKEAMESGNRKRKAHLATSSRASRTAVATQREATMK